MSYYLKYRPQTVQELDLVGVRAAFKRLLESGEFAHAYLFAGPKGTGKTSSARILAKILNCEKNKDKLSTSNKLRVTGKTQSLVEPCGVCEGCVSVRQGTNMAVLEMDAASNRGIDDIRQLRERINLAPAVGMFTVYVIDEVHMLTTEAFNALLKTLEEPPAHVVFVLCTTDLHKVPDTVISRCVQIPFTRATASEIQHSLQKAVDGEKLAVADGVLVLIAERADGSFRDAMKLLEQAAQEGKQVTSERVNELTGYTTAYDPNPLITAMVSRDVRRSMDEIATKVTAGVDFSVYGQRLVEAVRQSLIEMATKGNHGQLAETAQLAERLSQAVVYIKTAVIPSLPLEIAAVEWCLGGGVREVQKVSKVPEAPKLPERHSVREESKPEPPPEEPEGELEPPPDSAGVELNFDLIKEKWAEVLKLVKPFNHSLEALLRAAQPVAVADNWLTIEVAYTFHKEQLEQERHRRIIEKTIAQVVNQPTRIKFILGKKIPRVPKAAAEAVANVTGTVEDEALAKAAEDIFK